MAAFKQYVLHLEGLENLRIETRLQLAFACVLVLMFAGNAISFWNLQRVGDRVVMVSTAERRLAAVLRVNNSLLMLVSRLHRAAEDRNSSHFESEARKLLENFPTETPGAMAALREIAPATGRAKLVVDSLGEIVETLPERLAALGELARAGDWVALNARLANQVDHTDDVAEALMREADADLSQAQNLVFEDINHAQHRAAEALAVTSILSFLIAAALGLLVTRSITRPLANLGAGARALARGNFDYRIAVRGSNELASLAAVFDQTAGELADLYGQLRASEARFRSLIENASDLILLASGTGKLLYVSPSSSRLLGYPPELILGGSIRELLGPDDISIARR
jgi:nitrate/nitrite-specific signal transduction histidine kinase